jgi:hypothetical protein
MFLKKALFLYFGIALVFLITVIILNSTQDKDRWLQKLPPAEQKLYALEKESLICKDELNMTKAALYYSEQESYCRSFKEASQSHLCFKRTQPWWDNLYKTKSNLSNIKE